MGITVFITLACGLMMLSLAMGKHYKKICKSYPGKPRRFTLRVVGWGLLVISFWAAVATWGWGLSIVLWLGLFSAAALVVIILLTLVFGR